MEDCHSGKSSKGMSEFGCLDLLTFPMTLNLTPGIVSTLK